MFSDFHPCRLFVYWADDKMCPVSTHQPPSDPDPVPGPASALSRTRECRRSAQLGTSAPRLSGFRKLSVICISYSGSGPEQLLSRK